MACEHKLRQVARISADAAIPRHASYAAYLAGQHRHPPDQYMPQVESDWPRALQLAANIYYGSKHSQEFLDYTLLGRPFPTLTGLGLIATGTTTSGLLLASWLVYGRVRRQRQLQRLRR